MNYAARTILALSQKTGWSLTEAEQALGDPVEYETEGLTPEEAAEAALDAIAASQ